MKLVVPAPLMKQIRAHGEETYPHECCGFLFGQQDGETRTVVEVRRQANERTDSRENRFLITPEQFRDAERAARKAGLLMLGIYHSHPDSPARPSEYDRDHAWPWYSYLITSVGNGTSADSRLWQLRDDRSGFDPRDLEVAAGSPGSDTASSTARRAT